MICSRPTYCNITCRQRIRDLNMQTRVAVSSGQTEGLQLIAAEDPVCTTSKKGLPWAWWPTSCKIKAGSRRKLYCCYRVWSSDLHQASPGQTSACAPFEPINRLAVLS